MSKEKHITRDLENLKNMLEKAEAEYDEDTVVDGVEKITIFNLSFIFEDGELIEVMDEN